MNDASSAKQGLFVVVTVAILGAASLGLYACGESADARSPENYCRAFYEKGVKLHDQYQEASDDMETDLLGGLLTLIQSPGDMATLLDDMAAAAPEEIRSDTEAARDALKDQQDSMGDALSDPLGALGSSFALALTSSGSFKRVDEYLNQHCPLDSDMAREYGVNP